LKTYNLPKKKLPSNFFTQSRKEIKKKRKSTKKSYSLADLSPQAAWSVLATIEGGTVLIGLASLLEDPSEHSPW